MIGKGKCMGTNGEVTERCCINVQHIWHGADYGDKDANDCHLMDKLKKTGAADHKQYRGKRGRDTKRRPANIAANTYKYINTIC